MEEQKQVWCTMAAVHALMVEPTVRVVDGWIYVKPNIGPNPQARGLEYRCPATIERFLGLVAHLSGKRHYRASIGPIIHMVASLTGWKIYGCISPSRQS